MAVWIINCALFGSFVVCKKLNATNKLQYTFFLLRLMNDWASNDSEAAEEDVVKIVVNMYQTCFL